MRWVDCMASMNILLTYIMSTPLIYIQVPLTKSTSLQYSIMKKGSSVQNSTKQGKDPRNIEPPVGMYDIKSSATYRNMT